MSRYRALFEENNIGSVTLKNRFAMAPMGPLGLSDHDGGFNQRGIDYYTERARGGTGLIITGVTFADHMVEKHTTPGAPSPTMNAHQFIRTGIEMTERIHAYGSKIFLMMSAGFGRVSIPEDQGADDPAAPSPIPHRWIDKTCRAISIDEIHAIINSLGQGAAIAKRAGFDGIMIHAVHEGYLMDQFAISMFNQRTDEYGGSVENRLRFAKEVREAIADTCGWDFPVAMRFSAKSFIKDWRSGALPGESFAEKGRDLPEGLQMARLLEEYGYDALDVDVGCYDSWWWNHPPMYQEKGLYLEYAKAVKEVVGIPILCAGRMDDPEMAVQAVEKGWIDIVSLGRPLLADAGYVRKLHSGRQKDIRPCISCQEGCMGRIQNFSLINCAVNPQCARERDFSYRPVCQKKKVIIVGGGVAGMEAARVLSIRGHEPVVYEAAETLGGALLDAGAPSFKEDDLALIRWYMHTLKESGVEIHCNTLVTAEMLSSMQYDALILATGAEASVIDLGGHKLVLSAREALRAPEKTGNSVAVIGGGMVGCEAALWLKRDLSKEVTLIESREKLLAVNAPICSANKDMLERLVSFSGCRIMLHHTAVATTPEGLLVRDIQTGEQEELKVDTVILAIGFRKNDSLYAQMQTQPEIYVIGDCRQPKNVHQAIWDAFEVANGI